jgi:serine/threonine protein kinase
MGTVYRATQLSLRRAVAIKVLRAGTTASPWLLARFRTEAQAMGRLHHPHIVHVFDFADDGLVPYLVMEFVEGTDLGVVLARRPRQPRWCARLVVMVARAIHHAHQQGIVHRDLKPAHILLTAGFEGAGRWVPKVCDWSVAKVLDAEDALTQAGQCLGAPVHVS